VPVEIILGPVVYRRKHTVLSDPVQQSGAPEHLPHWILQLGKQDLGFFGLGNQAEKRIGGRQINSKIGMKIEESGLGRGADGERTSLRKRSAFAKNNGRRQGSERAEDQRFSDAPAVQPA
jgi:hypothetical protein